MTNSMKKTIFLIAILLNTALVAAQSDIVNVKGTQNVTGLKKFLTSPIVPIATTSTQAVNKGQLDLKANLISPIFTGVPEAPTAPFGTSNLQIANTEFVNSVAVTITGDQTVSGIKSFNSPILYGVPLATTAPLGTNTDRVATTAFVNTAITNNGTITTSTSITNATLTDASLPQNGKTLLISNGLTNINYTINGSITASFVKGGTGSITFVQGSGRTMVAANGTLVFNGAQYSTASVVSFGTTDIVYINNF